MAVTINGDGTISGVSVGGLPDGVVDSGTLATNSVDSAELIDGAVDNSHLATGIDATKLADGTITNSELQYINSLSSNAQTQISAAGGQYALLYTTYDSSTTGTMALTGAGFTPKAVQIMIGQPLTSEISWGYAASTGTAYSMNNRYNEGDNTWTIQPQLAFAIEGVSTYTYLAVSSFDSDGITFTKSKGSSPTGTMRLCVFLFA